MHESAFKMPDTNFLHKFQHTSKTKKRKRKKNWDQTNLGTIRIISLYWNAQHRHSEFTSSKIKFLFKSVTMRDLGDHKCQHQILGISF